MSIESFKVEQVANGHWRLFINDVPIEHLFETLPEAEAGIRRLVNPVVYHYDKKGKKLD